MTRMKLNFYFEKVLKEVNIKEGSNVYEYFIRGVYSSYCEGRKVWKVLKLSAMTHDCEK